MKKQVEVGVYVALIAVLSAMVGLEGSRNTELQSKAQLTPKKLYAKLSNPQLKLQIVDAREDLSEYEDTHVPGALPFPGCDVAKLPEPAKDRVYGYVPTVIITSEGDAATFEKCRAQFAVAWNLAGGMTAWSDQNLPEDSGEYTPPKSSAGGGCL